MDLHSIASGAISAINPMVNVTIYKSIGYSTALDGTRTPAYASPVNVLAQVQHLTAKEIQHLNELNITGILRKIYLEGQLNSMDRAAGIGGDVVVYKGDTWLVVATPEQWPDWTCCVIQKQAVKVTP